MNCWQIWLFHWIFVWDFWLFESTPVGLQVQMSCGLYQSSSQAKCSSLSAWNIESALSCLFCVFECTQAATRWIQNSVYLTVHSSFLYIRTCPWVMCGNLQHFENCRALTSVLRDRCYFFDLQHPNDTHADSRASVLFMEGRGQGVPSTLHFRQTHIDITSHGWCDQTNPLNTIDRKQTPNIYNFCRTQVMLSTGVGYPKMPIVSDSKVKKPWGAGSDSGLFSSSIGYRTGGPGSAITHPPPLGKTKWFAEEQEQMAKEFRSVNKKQYEACSGVGGRSGFSGRNFDFFGSPSTWGRHGALLSMSVDGNRYRRNRACVATQHLLGCAANWPMAVWACLRSEKWLLFGCACSFGF